MTQQITPCGLSEHIVIPASQGNLPAPAWASQQTDPKSDRQGLCWPVGVFPGCLSTGIAVFAGVNRWNLMQSLPLFLAVFIRQVLHSNSEITGDSISLISASRPLPFLSHSYHWSAVGGKTGGFMQNTYVGFCLVNNLESRNPSHLLCLMFHYVFKERNRLRGLDNCTCCSWCS